MLLGLFIVIWIILLRWPDTAIGQALRRMMIIAPARILNGVERRQVLFIGIMLLVVLVGAGSIAGVMSADLAMLAAWDASLYVDTLIAVWTVAAVSRGGGAFRLIGARIAATFRGRQAGRTRRSRRTGATARKPANDDEDRAPLRRAA